MHVIYIRLFCSLFFLSPFQLLFIFFYYRCKHSPTPSNISKMANAFPFVIAQAMQTHLLALYVCAVVHVDKWWLACGWKWVGVEMINQHNECRWGLCRWSPHSGLCHAAGSRFAPFQCLCTAMTVCPGHVLLSFLLNFWIHFCMILFYNQILLHQKVVYNQRHVHIKDIAFSCQTVPQNTLYSQKTKVFMWL